MYPYRTLFAVNTSCQRSSIDVDSGISVITYETNGCMARFVLTFVGYVQLSDLSQSNGIKR